MCINIILMGEKKPKKTEELSVALAEASSTGEEDKTQRQKPLVQPPRKLILMAHKIKLNLMAPNISHVTFSVLQRKS